MKRSEAPRSPRSIDHAARARTVLSCSLTALVSVTGCGATVSTAPRATPTASPPPPAAWLRSVVTTGTSTAFALAPGPDHTLYLAGRVDNGPKSRARHEIFLARLDPAGHERWRKVIRGGLDDARPVLASDPSGHVVLAGGFTGHLDVDGNTIRGHERSDAFVLRFDADGGLTWERHAGSESYERVYGVAADARGNVYLTGNYQDGFTLGGNTFDTSRSYGYFVAKLGPGGEHVWSQGFPDDGITETRGSAIALGSDGDVYVTGVLRGHVPTTRPVRPGRRVVPYDLMRRAFVTRLAPDGTARWLRRLPATWDAWSNAIALGPDGGVYVAGSFEREMQLGEDVLHTAGGSDGFVARLEPDGTPAWGRRFGGAGFDGATALAVRADGRVCVGGTASGRFDVDGAAVDGLLEDGVLAAFERDGTRAWWRRAGSVGDDAVTTLWGGDPDALVLAGAAGGPVRIDDLGLESLRAPSAYVARITPPARDSAPGNDPLRTRGPRADVDEAVDNWTDPARPNRPGYAWISINVVESGGKPIAGAHYVIEHVTPRIEGTSSPDGNVAFEWRIGPETPAISFPDRGTYLPVTVGTLDPFDAWSGGQQRLQQLGFFVSDNSDSGDASRELRRFQQIHHLRETGRYDAATQSVLHQFADN